MKKILFLLLFLTHVHVHAHTLVEHNSNRPANLDTSQKPQVINVWATWCAPCRREMPILDRWQQRHGHNMGVQLIGISLDNADKTRHFLQQYPVRYPIWRYTGSDSAMWMKTIGNSVGALPFTLVRRNGCVHQQTFLGEITEVQLQQAVAHIAQQCSVSKSHRRPS